MSGEYLTNYERRKLKKEELIAELVSKLPKLPKDFERFIYSKRGQFILGHKKNGHYECICTACNNKVNFQSEEVDLKYSGCHAGYYPSLEKKLICPNCERELIFINNLNRVNIPNGDANFYVSIVQASKDGIQYIRTFFCSQQIKNFKSIIITKFEEVIRDIYYKGKWQRLLRGIAHGAILGQTYFDTNYYDEWKLIQGSKTVLSYQGYPVENSRYKDIAAHLYPDSTLIDKFKYLKIDWIKSSRLFAVKKIFDKYIEDPRIEFLLKNKFYELALEYSYSIYLIDKMTKVDYNFLSENFEWLDFILLYFSVRYRIHNMSNLHRLTYSLKDSDDAIIINWAIKTLDEVAEVADLNILSKKYLAEKNTHFFVNYKDYINNCKTLNYDLKSNKVLYPDNFMKAHDEVMILAQAEINAEKDKKLLLMLDSIIYFEKEIDDYMFILPKSTSELIHEGKQLEHCVGINGYIDKILSRESLIVFLRKLSQPEIPFYTLEIDFDSKKLIQCETKKHGTLDEATKPIVDKYLKEIKMPIGRTIRPTEATL